MARPESEVKRSNCLRHAQEHVYQFPFASDTYTCRQNAQFETKILPGFRATVSRINVALLIFRTLYHRLQTANHRTIQGQNDGLVKAHTLHMLLAAAGIVFIGLSAIQFFPRGCPVITRGSPGLECQGICAKRRPYAITQNIDGKFNLQYTTSLARSRGGLVSRQPQWVSNSCHMQFVCLYVCTMYMLIVHETTKNATYAHQN